MHTLNSANKVALYHGRGDLSRFETAGVLFFYSPARETGKSLFSHSIHKMIDDYKNILDNTILLIPGSEKLRALMQQTGCKRI